MAKTYSEINKSLSYSKNTISEEIKAREKLLEDMAAADIPGISVVVIKNGKLTSVRVEGTVHSTRCGFLQMLKLPSKEDQKRFHKSYFILSNNAMYYFNKSEQSLKNIPLNEMSLKQVRDSFGDQENIDILSEQQLKKLELITNWKHSSPSEKVNDKTVFAVASLSKAVFAYLVLKLIQIDMKTRAETGKGLFKTKFDLDTPLYESLPDEKSKNEWLAKFADVEKAKKLTAKMVLSHTTGLPITHDIDNIHKPISFLFEPGTKFGYSGPGITYLQFVIEKITDSDLETLAQKYVFHQEGYEMSHSSFATDKTRSPGAANSLYTTSSDYANFLLLWMNDEKLLKLFDPFKPVEFMSNLQLENGWPIHGTIDPEHKKQVAWGLGVGLQTNKEGKAIRAYHTGDMDEWRAFFVVNLEEKSAIVYFANGHNGYIILNQVVPEEYKLEPMYDCFFNTYGFAGSLKELHGVTNMHGINPSLLKMPESKDEQQQVAEIKSELQQESESSSEYKVRR